LSHRYAAAHLQLREPSAALALFDAALALEPGCSAAAKGKTAAARAAGAAAAERAADADRARTGARAPLPAAHSWPSLDDAAQALLAAEEVLAHNPNLEAGFVTPLPGWSLDCGYMLDRTARHRLNRVLTAQNNVT
jgi:hypothetical protein